MNTSKTLLVVARKYNDIFYAISIPEWDQYTQHILVIIAEKNFAENFPLPNIFNDIIKIKYSGKRNGNFQIIQDINIIKKRIQCSTITMSNIVLSANMYLIKVSGAKTLLLLEDGLMNYYDFKPSQSKTKQMVQWLLGINERKIFNSISKTYLLAPTLASYYGGDPRQLKLNKELIFKHLKLENLENKVIFVGQCLYKMGYMSLDVYNERVNKIIQQYNINYYLPHAFALDGENIDCPRLNLEKSHATLEIFASQYNFTVYSFCSSVLYTTKIINPNVQSFLIRIPELSNKSDLPIIQKYCNGIIDF